MTLHRKTGIARTKPMKRSRIKPKGRKPSEFARIYGSRARVAWIKAQPCLYCRLLSPFFGRPGTSENAHTVSGGKGRKADADTIVPLCPTHHKRYDEYKHPFERDAEVRQVIKNFAAVYEARWQQVAQRRAS